MRKTKRRPFTVGKILRIEFMDPMGISSNTLAETIGVNRNTISRILNDQQALTAPIAIKLGVAFDNSPEFWLNIQHAVEMWDIRNGKLSEHAEGIQCLNVHGVTA